MPKNSNGMPVTSCCAKWALVLGKPNSEAARAIGRRCGRPRALPVLLPLAAAGVGTLGVVDDDTVSLSNLQRQVIFGTDDVGNRKVDGAEAAVIRLNPHVAVETHMTRLTAANALDLISKYDIVADGSDNFATRYLVSDATAILLNSLWSLPRLARSMARSRLSCARNAG